MATSSNRYRADLRDFRFVLFEQFKLGALLGSGHFEDWGPEEVSSVLSEAYRYAVEVAGPLGPVGDREGCRLVDGKVRTPSGFKAGYERLYAGGFKSLTLEPEWGGARAPKSLAILVNELTSGPNAALDMYGGLTLGAAELVEAFGTPDQKQRFCHKMFSGEWAGTMCLTEPQAGSDVGEAATVATKNPDGTYAIRGTKMFISGGDQDITENIIHMVLARVPGAPKGTRGLSLFVVPKLRLDGTSNDVKVPSIEHKMGLNGSSTCVVNFGDDGACVGELVGAAEGQGMRQMFQMMNFARIGVGVQGLACASTAYLNALAYARERKQGPRIENARDVDAPRVAILEHADIRRTLLEMKAKIEGIRAMVVKAGWHHDAARQEPDASRGEYHAGQIELLTPLIKAYASDQGFRIAELAIQIFGGAGYTQDHPVEQYCRDAKIFAIYEGTNHIQALDLVGRKLGQAKGANARAFFGDVLGFVAKHRQHPRLGPAVAELERAANAAAAGALQLSEWSTGQLARVSMVATDYLNSLSEVCVGWLLLDAAVLAAEALPAVAADHPDHAFYQGKVQAAEYFALWVLPVATTRLKTLQHAPTSPLDIPDHAFAGV